MEPISQRPYMIRAIYQWIVDNDWRPFFQVDANFPGVELPTEYVDPEGSIVLNLAPTAVQALELGNDLISFRARFAGIERKISFSPDAVLAVFSPENNQGMAFEPVEYPEEDLAEPASATKKVAHLKIVK